MHMYILKLYQAGTISHWNKHKNTGQATPTHIEFIYPYLLYNLQLLQYLFIYLVNYI